MLLYSGKALLHCVLTRISPFWTKQGFIWSMVILSVVFQEYPRSWLSDDRDDICFCAVKGLLNGKESCHDSFTAATEILSNCFIRIFRQSCNLSLVLNSFALGRECHSVN